MTARYPPICTATGNMAASVLVVQIRLICAVGAWDGDSSAATRLRQSCAERLLTYKTVTVLAAEFAVDSVFRNGRLREKSIEFVCRVGSLKSSWWREQVCSPFSTDGGAGASHPTGLGAI